MFSNGNSFSRGNERASFPLGDYLRMVTAMGAPSITSAGRFRRWRPAAGRQPE